MNTITCNFDQYQSALTISLNQLKLGVFQLSLHHESKEESSEVGKLFSKFCKHLLGVHKNIINIANHGELGTYPLHINIKI